MDILHNSCRSFKKNARKNVNQPTTTTSTVFLTVEMDR